MKVLDVGIGSGDVAMAARETRTSSAYGVANPSKHGAEWPSAGLTASTLTAMGGAADRM
jgi:hypothetical protein